MEATDISTNGAASEVAEESKTVPADPYAGMSDEEKQKSMKESLANLIS